MPPTTWSSSPAPASGLSGSGEAEVFLGSLEVTTDSSGEAIFDVPFTPPAQKPIVTATATDREGNTSELSGPRRTVIQAPAEFLRFAPGGSLFFSAATRDAVVLQDPGAGPLEAVWDLSLSIPAGTGTLSLSTTDGLAGTGNDTGALNYRGDLIDLNAALEGMRFSPASGTHGKLILTIEARSDGARPLSAQVTLTDGVLPVTTTADAGPGSLRQAILDADVILGPATITFAIPGPGVHTIIPTTALPALPAGILIDGTTQPGYAGTPLIELSGQSAGAADGLTINVSGTTVRGLAIDGFASGAGILIDGPGASGNLIEGNLIGTDLAGTTTLFDGVGVRIAHGAHDNTVGGTDPALGNTIAGDAGSGVVVTGDGSVRNRILGNRMFDNNRDTPTPDGKLGFDGSNYVILPGDLIGTFKQAETIETWFQTTSGGVIFDRLGAFPSPGSDPPVEWGSALFVGSDGMLYGGLDGFNPIASNTRVDDGRWHRVALVVDGAAQTLSLYLDGHLAGTTQGTVYDFSGESFNLIGTGYDVYPNAPSGAWYGFRGQIDEFKIWSEVRTVSQIQTDMSTSMSGAEPGLEAYYRFDDGGGTTAYDATSNHRDASLGTSGSNLPDWISRTDQAIDLGAGGSIFPDGHEALQFDGSGGYVKLPSFTLGGALTLEAWVRSDNVHANGARIFDFGDGEGPDNLIVYWDGSTGRMAWDIHDPGGNWRSIETDRVFPQGQWVHVAATVDDQGNAALYWDGELVASGAMYLPQVTARANQYLGRSNWPSDSSFTGALDEVKIWSVARTADEIRADMTAVPNGSEPGLEAYYRLDEGQGNAIYDATPNHRNAALASSEGSFPTWVLATGIDPGADGVTYNAQSPRLGPNQLQNYPIVVATADGRLRGWLGGSLPSTTTISSSSPIPAMQRTARARPRSTSARSRSLPMARARLFSTSRIWPRRASRSSPPPRPIRRATPPRSRRRGGRHSRRPPGSSASLPARRWHSRRQRATRSTSGTRTRDRSTRSGICRSRSHPASSRFRRPPG